MSQLFLDQLLHQGMTAGSGMKPKPVRDGSEEMVRVPVLIALCRPGETTPFAWMPAVAMELVPHRRPVRDRETGQLVERPAACVLSCQIPDLAGDSSEILPFPVEPSSAS